MDGNGICQSLELFLVKFPTGLVGIGFDFVNRQFPVSAGLQRFFGEIPQQCA